MGEKRNEHNILIGKPEAKRNFEVLGEDGRKIKETDRVEGYRLSLSKKDQ
jgi:hypothetical protein